MKKNYIIIPTYNDWKSLKKVLNILNNSIIDNANIIVVDDHSSEKSTLNKKKLKNIKSLKIISLKKNVGSQKAIYLGLKYLKNKLKRNNSQSIISILDSDGEDNPRVLKKLIQLASKKNDYFIFAARKERTEGRIFRLINKLRLYFTYALTGKFMNYGNFSAFSSNILKNILKNENIFLAFSSGVVKNYKKIFFLSVKKNKRYFGKSKVNLGFLVSHSLKIISVFYDIVFLRTFLLLLTLIIFFKKFNLEIIFIFVFILLNLSLFILNKISYPRDISKIIKKVKLIK